MKKLFAALTILTIAACAFSTPASAQNASDKAALVQRYYWYEELLASANSEDLIAMQTADFVNVPLNSKEMSRAQSDAMVRINADSVQRVHGANVTINKLDIHGDYAIATVTQFFDSENKDANGVVRRIASNMIARQLWTRTEDGWLLQRTRTLRGQAIIDGQRITF